MPSEPGDETAPAVNQEGENYAPSATDEGAEEPLPPNSPPPPTLSDTAGNNATNLEREPTRQRAKSAPKSATEPFERWERDEMEKLLNELNGHLGKPLLRLVGGVQAHFFVQSYSPIDSWKERMWLTTSCSMQTGSSFDSLTLGMQLINPG